MPWKNTFSSCIPTQIDEITPQEFYNKNALALGEVIDKGPILDVGSPNMSSRILDEYTNPLKPAENEVHNMLQDMQVAGSLTQLSARTTE